MPAHARTAIPTIPAPTREQTRVRTKGRTSFDPKEVLRRTGLRTRHEARAARSDFSTIGDGLAKLGAGDLSGTAGNFVLLVLGGLFGLIMLNLLLSNRGSKVASAAISWSGGALGRLVSPTDPLTGVGTSTAPAAPSSSGTPATAATSPAIAAAAPSSKQYGGGLYPTPSGDIVPVPGSSSIDLDSSYTSLAGWIEQHFGVTITSGYRTAADNAAAGGAQASDHLKGLAADFGGSTAALTRLYQWASAFGFPYIESEQQTIAAGEGPHVHISFFRPSTN